MTRLGLLARTYWFDAVVVLLSTEACVELAIRRNEADAPTMSLWLAVPAILLTALPLLLRRRFPFGGPAAYWLLGAALSFFDGRLLTFETSVFVLGMAAAFLLGNVRDTIRARAGLAIVVGSAALIVYNLPESDASTQIFIPLLFGVCWLAGFALRDRVQQAEAAELRAAQAEHEREVAARIAVAEERARIARELHDVVAHSVSVMVLQAGAVRHKLPPELDDDRAALGHVERTGRAALAEMRRLLGAMRSDGDRVDFAPQPGVDGLDALVEEVELAGLAVELHVDGKRFALPRAIDLSAYRIVQEGLTNALKHARATRADVTLGYAPDQLRIEVRDDGRGASSNDGRGHGLVGIRERVKIYGGEMSATTRPEGGFVLTARLPIERNGS